MSKYFREAAMSDYSCYAAIVTCIDFRFQPYINQWVANNFQVRTYDRVAWAGGIKDQEGILKQVEIARRLHQIKKVVLVNHEDCLAYGKEGTSERHARDLKEITEKILARYPEMEVETYYLHLDGTFERVS